MQPRDHLVGAELARAQRLERDEHAGRVGAAGVAAGKSDHVIDGRIGLDDVDELRQPIAHRLERSVLVGQDCAHQAPGVLLREEALGNDR